VDRAGGVLIAALSALLTGVAGAGAKDPGIANSTAIVDVTDEMPGAADPIKNGKARRKGEARWTEVLEQHASQLCDDEVKDCVRTQIRVRNDSARPIQCRIEAPKWLDDNGEATRLEKDHVIFGGNTAIAAHGYGPKAKSGRKFSVRCEIFAETYVPLAVPPACEFKLVSVPNPDDYYPRGAKRREESGDVVVEASIRRGSQEFSDLRVAMSSGFEDLDNAALGVAKDARGQSKCPKQRYRFKIRFVIRERDWG
jgi:TonB family protein